MDQNKSSEIPHLPGKGDRMEVASAGDWGSGGSENTSSMWEEERAFCLHQPQRSKYKHEKQTLGTCTINV